RILVVDDEKRVRHACRRFLCQEGCEVQLAENGIDGLKMIEKTHYDIILLDLMMPGICGLDVLKRVKSLHPDTVVIVISGYATLEHAIDAMKKGAFDFISKPFSPQDLRIVIIKSIEFIRTLQDIATEKSRMRVMINSLCNGVLTTDNQKNVALANPAFRKLMGCKIEKVIGRPVSDWIKEPKVLSMIDQAIDQPEKTFVEITDEITIKDAKTQNDTILGARCIPFRDRLKRNLGTVTVLQDITALKKIDQLKSDFVSMVAHELKSPLNSILMQLNVVLDGLAGDLTDKQQEILSRNHDKIKSLTTLTSELLDLSKIESGLINQEREELDLVEIMKEQVDFYTDKASSKSIKISSCAKKENIHIMGNKENIEEVFSNLISNAIRYTPDGGKICVDIESKNDQTI
ncbi:MAG: response regulator, partial [Desulfobacteraceae bacterium]|nr:response regulator [Desulfobacteraceae bacterium]